MRKSIRFVMPMLLLPALCQAHEGARVWIGNVGGKVTTLASDNDLAPTTYTPSRVFEAELAEVLSVYTTDFPAFEVRRDGLGDVAGGTTFGFDVAGPAYFYDDAIGAFRTTAAQFGPPAPGPVPQMAVSSLSDLRVTADEPVAGFDFMTFNFIGDHAHLSFTLLGDGVTTADGPDGVYALPLSLHSTGLATSDVFYIVIGKNVADEDPAFEDAMRAARSQFLPCSEGPGAVHGDANCDGVINNFDIDAFVAGIIHTNETAPPAEYSLAVEAAEDCWSARACWGDTNCDGVMNNFDIDPFVAVLLGAGGPCGN